MKWISIISLFVFASITELYAVQHPFLSVTKDGVEALRKELGNLPLLEASIEKVKSEVEVEMSKGISVPYPKDLAGGFTHEQHKRNFFTLQKAGVLFQITENEKYAQYVKDMLLQYMEVYPKVDRHPATRSYARGKFFWQCLNDANWLVYTSQAYDCIYDWLDNRTRKELNTKLFRPYADFLSVETPQFFGRIHNHSTWANAAVGMIGLVMDDEELVNRALYGMKEISALKLKKDNDGGLIRIPGQNKSGFIAQIDHSFSPDGYYTEGPYYQRYAMYPFLVFAQGLQNSKPALGIFKYRDGVMIKAVRAILNQTNAKGEFFPLNDAQKGMSYFSRELILATNIAYYFGHQETGLLDIIEQQGVVSLSDAGLASAKAIQQNLKTPFVKKSIELNDGADGNEGAIGILRSRSNDFSAVLKYAKHGMGHGHFDKLGLSYYNGSQEVYQDYGAARWVNIEQKDGGGYLKENKTWAKQSIAHNTVVVNEVSHFNGKVDKADPHHSLPYFFRTEDANIQIASAKESLAYDGVEFHRTVALLELDELSKPLLLDIFRVESDTKNQYDLPFYYKGEILQTNAAIKQLQAFKPLGEKHGYQHLVLEASARINAQQLSVNWFLNDQFYTLTSAVEDEDEVLFGRIGANDPSFNLRRDPVFIIRKKDVESTTFASVTESHGSYSRVTELSEEAYGKVQAVNILKSDPKYTVVSISLKNVKAPIMVAISNNDNEEKSHHTVRLTDTTIEWDGPFKLIKPKTEKHGKNTSK